MATDVKELTAASLLIGGRYNWKHQPERLIYMGPRRYPGDRRTWHQFAKVEAPGVCWSEVLDGDISSFEESHHGSALTRTQFALDALVAAGHVTQAKVDQALALFPAPAGEPEMPANAAYWWSPKDGAMAGTWSSNTGPHPDWDVTHYFTTDQLRAYGDARAEHARRVAMEDAAKLCEMVAEGECFYDNTEGARAADNCVIAIRAAAPPQGEQT